MNADESPQAVAAITLSQLERMAHSIAKSGMFAVKTQEAAFTLLLIAQSEGIHPAQALMDYDVIQGKPALKSAAMLARFQRSGGKIKWLQASDACVEATFTHPGCDGPLTVKWDQERVKKAGLADKEMHQRFGQQMKRARCITEGVRAVAPQCVPLGMYSVEETQDMVSDAPSPIVSKDTAIALATQRTPMPSEQSDEHIERLHNARDINTLMHAYQSAVRECRAAKDDLTEATMQRIYQTRKAELAGQSSQDAPQDVV